MKKWVSLAAAGMVSLTLLLSSSPRSVAEGETGGTQAPTATPRKSWPYRVGLVDLEKVFKSYPKFEAAQKALQADAKAKQDELTQMRAEFKTWVDQHKSPELKQTPDNAKSWEEEATRREAKIAAEVQNAKRDFEHRESNLYATVYQDVNDVVKRVAEVNHLAMVMRYSDEEINSSESDSVVKAISRHVLYVDKKYDITSLVISTLNKQYQAALAPASGRMPAGN